MDEAGTNGVCAREGNDPTTDGGAREGSDGEIVGHTSEGDRGENCQPQAGSGEAEGRMMVVQTGDVSRREAGSRTRAGDDSTGRPVIDVMIDPGFVPQLNHVDHLLGAQGVAQG